MGDHGNAADTNSEAAHPAFRIVVADRRKFIDYVLVPGHPSGKGRIFLDLLGYRPRHEGDARALAAIYMAQARERFGRGECTLGRRDHYGQRYTIAIEVRERRLRSGWILRPDGTLWLVTPFVGFSD